VLCVVDRDEGGAAAVAEIGLTLHPLFTAAQLRAA
jgi:orotate phosphoribosyltransferase